MKKSYFQIIIVLFFLAVFGIAQNSLTDPDMWFHIKSGEIIQEKGIIFYDVFSQSDTKRAWQPYEWLFQLTLFWYTHVFTVDAVRYFIGLGAVFQAGSLYLIFRRVFHLDLLKTFFVIIFYTLLNYNVFTPRPQLVTFAFLTLNLFFILYFIMRNRNLLIFTIPITILWSNMHASVVVNTVIFVLFSVLVWGLYFVSRKNQYAVLGKTLLLFTILNVFASMLPPLYLTPYTFMYEILRYKSLYSKLILEWKPLWEFTGDLILYTFTTLVIAGAFLFISVKKRMFIRNVFSLPLIGLIVMGFFALRNTFYGYLALSLLLGWSLALLDLSRLQKTGKVLLFLAAIIILGIELWFVKIRLASVDTFLPHNAVRFIKNNQLKGNMFNQYSYGGYLLYHLYPEVKVFIDNRADVYLCCELPDYIELLDAAQKGDRTFSRVISSLLEKYNFSYFIITVGNDLLGSKISDYLISEPSWRLVFWDDKSEVFIRNNDLNKGIIDKYTAVWATPFGPTLFKDEQSDNAFKEYVRMDALYPSARSKNAVGFILFFTGRLSEAEAYFREAIRLNPLFTPAYANLGQAYITEGNLPEADLILQHGLEVAKSEAEKQMFTDLLKSIQARFLE